MIKEHLCSQSRKELIGEDVLQQLSLELILTCFQCNFIQILHVNQRGKY